MGATLILLILSDHAHHYFGLDVRSSETKNFSSQFFSLPASEGYIIQLESEVDNKRAQSP